jgi:RNA polymerase sigma factor (sigma-70 family)
LNIFDLLNNITFSIVKRLIILKKEKTFLLIVRICIFNPYSFNLRKSITRMSDIDKKNSSSDLFLCKRIAKGDREAEICFFEKYHVRVDNMLYNRLASLGRLSDIKDFRQDVWIEIIETLRANNYEGDENGISKYLYGITKNAVYKYLHRYSNPNQTQLNKENNDEFDFNTFIEKTELEDSLESRYIQKKIRTLPGIYKIVLKLRYVDGFSYAQIARELKISESTARGRIFYAFKILRRIKR